MKEIFADAAKGQFGFIKHIYSHSTCSIVTHKRQSHNLMAARVLPFDVFLEGFYHFIIIQ